MVHKTNKRAAIYCRVSTDDQNCDRQERDLLEYAVRSGYEVVGTWKETGSGVNNDRHERAKVLAIGQARKIDVVLVTELSRWGRSTMDLLATLQILKERNISLVAQTGFQLDLSTAQGKLLAGILASLAEFERDLLRERVKSGMAAAKAKGKKFGRAPGHFKADKLEPTVLKLSWEGRSYRQIAEELKISKTTVNAIVQRYRQRLLQHGKS